MSRRTTLPGAAELFRSTGDGAANGTMPTLGAVATRPGVPATRAGAPAARVGDLASAAEDPPEPVAARAVPRGVRQTTPRSGPRGSGERRPSGRERHEEKITVYVSAEELMDLEHTRLALRGEHGLAVDRGRLVREALSALIADFEAKGDNSLLVRRLRGR